jgi:hypothetical protein
MKQLKFTLLLITSLITLNTYGQLTNGLRAYYPFGGNVNDNSGNNNNGILVGSPTLTTDRFGYSNCAYQFPGNENSYISVPYSDDFNIADSNAFSISLWYQGGTSAVGDFEILFLKNNPDVNITMSDYHLALYDLNKPSFGSKYSPVTFGWNVSNANWHHVVAIYNYKKWYLYEADTLRDTDTSGKEIYQSTGNITIGKNFQGKIDDIRFYNRELTAIEIHSLFKLPGSCYIDTTKTSIYEPQQENSFNVFPNPTSNNFAIVFAKEFNNQAIIEVFNITGQKIDIEYKINLLQVDVNLLDAPNGLYLVKITDAGRTYTQRLQKQN